MTMSERRTASHFLGEAKLEFILPKVRLSIFFQENRDKCRLEGGGISVSIQLGSRLHLKDLNGLW